MHTITPHLWFDTEAVEAVNFYTSVFPDSKITHQSVLRDTPSGDCDILSFTLAEQPFMAISAGPLFKLNPSISFHVKCATVDEVDEIWGKLIEGGAVLMELDSYPFSKRYGWLQDKYGVSWQIIHAGEQPITQKIVPVLMYTGDRAGRAEEAAEYYVAVFNDAPAGSQAKVAFLSRYGAGQDPDNEGTIQYGHVILNGMELGVMDSAREHEFSFNEAISLMIPCENQDEINYFWEKLSADPSAEQCGWLKDKFGVSWQVTSTEMDEMMAHGTPEQIARVTQAFLPMKKLDVATLKKAYAGEA